MKVIRKDTGVETEISEETFANLEKMKLTDNLEITQGDHVPEVLKEKGKKDEKWGC